MRIRLRLRLKWGLGLSWGLGWRNAWKSDSHNSHNEEVMRSMHGVVRPSCPWGPVVVEAEERGKIDESKEGVDAVEDADAVEPTQESFGRLVLEIDRTHEHEHHGERRAEKWKGKRS
ncbi:hypothetical protein C8R42DRAFT_682665 [Lentinula raphanica]|nr:hypothetical protein C8R42DRAFT_682665 [Lentinula raphanica]